jgi:RNA polymerase sigma-54 factor
MARIATALAPRQTQRLAPGQQQALALLQLPVGALAALVEAALAENPLLTRRDETGGAMPVRRRGFAVGRGGLPMLPTAPAAIAASEAAVEQIADPGATTLRAHLVDQLRLEIADPVERTIGLHLIDLVEETGYLSGSPADIARLLGVEPARVARVLERLREFEPAGVFARSLADCLWLQLDPAERADPAWRALLGNLLLLAANERARLATLCGVDAVRLDAMIRRVRTLDPKPGLRFGAEAVVWTMPDVLVERDPAAPSGYRVRLNPGSLPGCKLDVASYRRLVAAARDRREKSGLRAQYDSARSLLSALEWRGATLLAITEEIVRQQRGFLDAGLAALRPLTRRRVAGELELDESTISRAVSGKTIETPRGLFGFDFFFLRALPRDAAGSVSAARVRARLAELLKAEAQPLDDAALAGLLAAEGMPVARRTVAKYRKSLLVPPVHRRRGRAGLRRAGGNPDSR